MSDNGSYFERRIFQLEKFRLVNQKALEFFEPETIETLQSAKAELLQLNRTQFPSLGIFVSKKVGNQKN